MFRKLETEINNNITFETMTKEEKRFQVAKVKAYDAAVESMNQVAINMAKEDMENEFQLEEEQARMRAISYMDSFKELLGERPEMPSVPSKLF